MEYPIPIPEEVKALLKVRVNHDLQDSDNGMWIASVSVYKALRFQQQRIARLEHELANPEQHSEHWRNPETGYIECECCQKWAMDMIEVKKQLAEANAEIIRLCQQIKENKQ